MSPVQVRPPLVADLVRDHEDIQDYHSDKEWLSKSQLWDFVSRGPLYFYSRHVAGTLNASAASPSMARGTHVHCWAEDPAAWWDRVVEIPDSALGSGGRRTKATEEWESGILAERPNAILLKADEIASYRQQFAAIEKNEVFDRLSAGTYRREVSIRWRHPSGLPMRCRPDALADGLICWDIKTTRSQMPLRDFWQSVIDYGYAFQQAHYSEGLRAAGFDVKQFVFLVTSTVPPFYCHAVTLPQSLVREAAKQRESVVAELQDRAELDHWLPPDSGRITELFVPERYLGGKKRGQVPSVTWER